MALAGALREHEGALRASLASEYPGLPPLRSIVKGATGVHLLDLADLVANLPPGCALWRATGGPMAWSQEMHMLVAIQHGLSLLEWENGGIMHRKPGGSPPKPIPSPPFANEQAAKEKRARDKRERYLARRATRRHGPPDA